MPAVCLMLKGNHYKGYIITELFYNGFSICFKTDEEAIQFRRVLYDLLDSFIHHDDKELESKMEEISEPIVEVKNIILNKALKEIYGEEVGKFSFYWVDEMENIRGYANSDEECRLQAKQQGCDKYFSVHMI